MISKSGEADEEQIEAVKYLGAEIAHTKVS
jgi:hypothetical protein